LKGPTTMVNFGLPIAAVARPELLALNSDVT
jgi:hypothetical protein